MVNDIMNIKLVRYRNYTGMHTTMRFDDIMKKKKQN